jgi:hypothetical protein
MHRPPTALTPMRGPWPFAQWGIDLIGSLPKGPSQITHAVVAVDYFTKWVEAKALATITSETVIDFIWKNVISRFGIPRVLVADLGKQFDSAEFRNYCGSKGIHVHYTSKAHPKANGQAEVTNREIKKGIKKRLRAAKGTWPEELHSVLWSYRTTPRAATGETPYAMAFGAEAVVPVEVELPNYRTASSEPQDNEEDLRTELDLLEEKREAAAARTAVYQQRMAKYFDATVKPRSFRPDDLVLRKVDPTGKKIGKLGPNWEGPYRVLSHSKGGSYRLTTLRGKHVPNPWNAEHLKKYYQ